MLWAKHHQCFSSFYCRVLSKTTHFAKSPKRLALDMSTETLLIIVVLVLLLGGGGFFYSRR